jgi:hypothetical protein
MRLKKFALLNVLPTDQQSVSVTQVIPTSAAACEPWGHSGVTTCHPEPFHTSLNTRPRILLPMAMQWNPLVQNTPVRKAVKRQAGQGG